MIFQVVADTANTVFNNPWVQGSSGLAGVLAIAYLIVKVVKLGNEQYELATDRAEELLEPMRIELGRLRAESQAERMWSQILVSRLERIIHEAGVPIPEEVWIRP